MMDNPITKEIAALRRAKPQSAAEERVRATELCRLNGILEAAARQAIDAGAAKRLSNGGANPPDVFSKEVLGALARGLYDWLGPILADQEKRIAELQARPTLQDAGVWGEEKVFHPGDIVSHDGSAFICKETNAKARPGQSDCWRLLVKRGKDARGAR